MPAARPLALLSGLAVLSAASGFTAQGPRAGILCVDHLNINHEAGRHDLLTAFYFDLLGFQPDPRKAANLAGGEGSVWANAGMQQLHLGAGPRAQVLDGVITVAYETLDGVRARLRNPAAALASTAFAVTEQADGAVAVTCPWGNAFRLVENAQARDARGAQPGAKAEAAAMVDLAVHVPAAADLGGIARFYDRVLGSPAEKLGDDEVVLRTAPTQTLTFRRSPAPTVDHAELTELEDGGLANDGVHVSLYVADLREAYRRATEMGVVFVNQRFKRKAYTEDEAADQCMFRLLDIVDPDDPAKTPILRLEHEVRSYVTEKGKLYKSAPFESLESALKAW